MSVGGTLFFRACDAAGGRELWKSDGTAAGTVRVKDIWPGSYGSYPYCLANMNGTLFFAANDGLSGHELWRSDGTAAGTLRVKDIIAGIGGSGSQCLTNVNGTLFFSRLVQGTLEERRNRSGNVAREERCVGRRDLVSDRGSRA